MRRLKKIWREAAIVYAKSAWHTPEYRYWFIEDQSKIEIAETARKAYGSKLSFAYTQAVNHPGSRKAKEQVRLLARELARIGFYLLEHPSSPSVSSLPQF